MKKILIFLVGILLLSSQAFATPFDLKNLDSFTGTSALENNTPQSDKNMYWLAEANNYKVGPSGLQVDLNAPGKYTTTAFDAPFLGVGKYRISADTVINSYFIHFNPIDSGSVVNVKSSLTFGPTEQILGIMTTVPSLLASNALVGNNGFKYNSSILGSLGNGEFGLDNQRDILNWALNEDGSTTLQLNLYAGKDALDEVRVITRGAAPVPEAAAPVPEPATMLLLGSGLIGLAGFGRKKLRRR